MSASATIPRPRRLPLIGNIASVDPQAPVQSLMAIARGQGSLFRLDFFGRSMLIVGDRALTDELCDETRFRKALHRPLQEVRAIGGDGLFTAFDDEPNWGKAHRLLMPAFGPMGLRTMFPAMLDVAEQMMLRWERFGPDARIDVADAMTRLTLDTIALTAFDYRFNSFYQNEMHPFVAAMVGALDESGKRARLPAGAARLMPLRNRRFEADRRVLREVADGLIAERRRDPQLGERGDLLDRMLTARDPETGERLSDENVGFQMVTFLTAGHETTSGLLSFATWLLLRHPHVLARTRDHVDAAIGGEAPTYEDIGRLDYLRQVLDETLRLWPTAPAFAVEALAPTIIGGRFAVTPDDLLLILTPAVHRDPAVWEQPEAFRPERFAPEAMAALPANAWKPFGNGKRACIGRGFAMQEAILVLATMLQRFDLSLADEDYELVISETLTLKPANLHIHARLRDGQRQRPPSRLPTAARRPLAAAQAEGAGARGPLFVLYGSNTGTSEAFAQRIGAEAAQLGYVPTVGPLDRHRDALADDAPLVVVTASYEGQPPDNARRFLADIEALGPGVAAGRRYAVFGCGNRQWAHTWQAIPMRIDAALATTGATPIVARGEGDAGADLFGAFDRWRMDLWQALAPGDGQAGALPNAAATLDVEVVRRERERALHLDDLQRGTVIANRELCDLRRPGARSRRHVTIRLPKGMSYRAGDYLQVLPSNPRATVARALARFGLAADDQLVLHAPAGAQGSASSLPVGRVMSAGALFGDYVELQQPATREQVARLAEAIHDPTERDATLRLADEAAYPAEVLDQRISLLDLLDRFPSAALPLGAFVMALPPMRARQYSIASSPLVDPRIAALTLTVLDEPALAGIGRHHGVASSYLAGLEPGDPVTVAVRPSQAAFHLPDDPATPLILVCAGSGIAPFRGFLEERALLKAQSATLGPALLFFGVRDPEVDFLHRDELERWQRDGIVDLRMAFSAYGFDGIVHVQDAIRRDRTEIATLFRAGARIFVCGDGTRMAPAVRDAFVLIYAEEAGVGHDAALAWADRIERESGRYVADIFN